MSAACLESLRVPTKLAGHATSQGVRNVLTFSKGTQVHDKSVPDDHGVGAVEPHGHVKGVKEQPKVDDALAALAFGSVEAEPGARDDGFQGVDLGEGAGVSRVGHSRPCRRRPGCPPRGPTEASRRSTWSNSSAPART